MKCCTFCPVYFVSPPRQTPEDPLCRLTIGDNTILNNVMLNMSSDVQIRDIFQSHFSCPESLRAPETEASSPLTQLYFSIAGQENNKRTTISVNLDDTVFRLQLMIAYLTLVEPANQKLVVNLRQINSNDPENTTLQDVGIKEHSEVQLILEDSEESTIWPWLKPFRRRRRTLRSVEQLELKQREAQVALKLGKKMQKKMKTNRNVEAELAYIFYGQQTVAPET